MTGDGVRLYQTIRKNGRLYVRGYVIWENGREEFELTETTVEDTFARLRRLRDMINAAHPRG